jgi:peptide/nickel transport system substrate-binding protein
MNRLGKGVFMVGAILCLGLFLTLWPGWAEGSEKVIILGDYSPLRTLDPAKVGISQDIMMCRAIYQSLLQYKFNSSEIEGDLAKSWKISDDGLVYTFKLREGVIWHKGFGKFTAHDVKYTFDRLLDPKTGAAARAEVAMELQEVRVIDDYTVEFRLKNPSIPFLHKLVGPRGTAIVNEKAVERFGKDYGRNPIGTGPFIFESWTREQCVLLANKDFQQRQGPPKFDKFIYKTIPDVDTMVLALEKGDIDLIWVMPREKSVVDRLKAAGRKITFSQRPTWQNLCINTTKKPFTDVRVRRAIAYALDKETLVKYVFSGMADPLDSPVPKGFFAHTEEGLPHYEYNPEKAKKLLAEAGYPNGFEVTLDTFQSPSYLPLATAMVEQLRKVNINVKLAVTDQSTWWKKLTNDDTVFTLCLPSLQPDPDFPMMRYYHSASLFPITRDASTCIENLDAMIEKARRESDEKKRREYYYQIQKEFMDKLPDIPLMMMQYAIPYKSHIAGIPEKDFIWGIDPYPLHFVEKK